MYIENTQNNNLHVEYEFFRNIFNTNFNIGFRAPYTDKCSTCTSLENRIASERDKTKKESLQTELKVHKHRANVFFEQLRTPNQNEITLSYDCQKNLVLPKVPDQEAYYRRQLYLYNFTVCQGTSHDLQSKDNTTAYVWTENEYSKASVQIASALYHQLNTLDYNGVTTVRLFADGCGGQNKNTTILYMLSHWLLNIAPPTVKEVLLLFPIVGHSYIPPDRVFGNLERQFKKHSVIENPKKYLDIFKQYVSVVRLGYGDCKVIDWKRNSDEIFKSTQSWHFKFQKAKKIVLRRNKSKSTILVRGDTFYNLNLSMPQSLCKRGKSLKNNHFSAVPAGVAVKKAKTNDVKRLLELHFGNEWESLNKLNFYKSFFDQQQSFDAVQDDQSDNEELDFDIMSEDDTEIPL